MYTGFHSPTQLLDDDDDDAAVGAGADVKKNISEHYHKGSKALKKKKTEFCERTKSQTGEEGGTTFCLF